MRLVPGAARKRLCSAIVGLFRPNFYRLHLLYFVLVIILASVIVYGSSTSDFSLSYIDSIFLCTSAMCNIGLKSANLGSLTGFQQSVLFVLMLMGDLTIVTISVVIIRRYYFSKRIHKLLRESRAGRHIAQDIQARQLGRKDQPESSKQRRASKPRESKPSQQTRVPAHLRGYGFFPAPWDSNHVLDLFRRFRKEINVFAAEHSYLSFQPTLDHKGRLTALNPEQEKELGGVEYRALKTLTWILVGYTVFWLCLVLTVMTAYTTQTNAANIIRTAQPGNLHPAWWSIFVTVSAYSNTGLDLLGKDMMLFAHDYLILIFIGAAILAGGTLYPVFLRLFIWLFSHCLSRETELHHSLVFLLHHPRRCYLLLFPRTSTWFLFATQVAINLGAWFFWIILGIGHPPIPGASTGQSVMDGLFQAQALRSAGFNITDISLISPALQLLYMVIVYTAAFPVIMSLRQSNVYEERSLGQTSSSKSGDHEDGRAQGSQLGVHIRNQLAYDIWYLAFCMFLIAIIEHHPLTVPRPGFSLFSLMFEVVSAYGTVGISLGLPNSDLSFSAAWHVLSKLVLLTVMLRGRHRILPMAIDRAVLLPGQELMEKLDRDYSENGPERPGWRDVEERILEEERGAQVETEKSE